MGDGVRMGMAVAIKHLVQAGKRVRSVAGLFALAALVAAFGAQGTVFAPRLQAQATEDNAAKALPTATQLSVSAEAGDTRTSATFTAHVTAPGSPAIPAGSVSFRMGTTMLGSAVLDENGFATYRVEAFPQGTQQVTALYDGTTSFATSTSPARPLDSTTTTVPDYTLTADKTSVTLKAGQYASIALVLTPENNFDQIVNFSCSGLPLATTCVSTPATVVPDGKNTPIGATLNIQTAAITGGTAKIAPAPMAPLGKHPLYAIVLPGMLALAGLGAARKRLPGLKMLSIALLAVGGLGLVACSANYSYYHHPPTVNKGTPTGLSTIVVYATSSTGSVAVVHTVNVALTVTN